MQPYEDYVEKFSDACRNLLALTPTVDSVDDLPSEDEELAFIKAFRDLIRLKSILSCFSNFNWEAMRLEGLPLDEQTFEDYKSKYLDLYEKSKSAKSKDKESILNDVDFELELIKRDDINVAYILRLLAALVSAKPAD